MNRSTTRIYAGMWLAGLALFNLDASIVASVVINEVMASNKGTVADEDGDFSDWLEIYNAGSEEVSLGNWSLSDKTSGEASWVFPDVEIGAGSRLVIWASGKDRRVAGSPLHANFSISAEGELLTLLRPDGTVEDSVSPMVIRSDYSYGRSPDGAAEWRFFAKATPGASNGDSELEALLSPPVLSHQAGFHPASFTLTISSLDAGVELRYTLDGSIPTSTSSLYVTPFPIVDRTPEPEVLARIDTGSGFMPPTTRIAKATTLRVRAYRANALESDVNTATYFVGPDMINRYDKPVVSITVDKDEFFGAERGIYVKGNNNNWSKDGIDWERVIHLELFETDGMRVISQNAGARMHGGASRDFATKTLRLYAREEYGASYFEHQIFPDAPYTRYKRLLLRPGGNDTARAIIHDGYNQRLVSHMRFETLAFRPSVVFINGEYWGLKNLRERYDKHYVARVYGVDSENIDFLTQRDGVEEGSNQHYRAMIAYMEQNDLSEMSHYREIQRQMDTDNFMDYQIAEIFLNNTDWPGNNIDFWRLKVPYTADAPYGQDGRWRWMLFDTDFGFGLYYSSAKGALHNEYHNTLAFATEANGPSWPNPPWSTLVLRSLLRNAEFRNEFINRFADQLNTALHPRRCLALLDEMWPQTWTGWDPVKQPGGITNDRFEHTQRWPGMYGGWGAINGWNGMRNFSLNRREAVFGHLQAHFGLNSKVDMTFDCNGGPGKLGINTVKIDGETLGVADPEQPYPWTGTYFSGVPVTVTAYPEPGYRFERWLELPGNLSPTVVIDPGNQTKLTAVFVEDAFYPVIDPHVLGTGDYTFDAWGADSGQGTFPAHTIIEQSATSDPTLLTNLDGVWLLSYNLTSRSRVVGLGVDGIGFINTANAQDVVGSGYLGSMRLGLNTSGREQILVSWTTGTVTPGERQYGMRLQYRAGNHEPFQDVVDQEGLAYEYLSDGVAGNSQDFGPVQLPESLDNVPYAEIRWRYYHVSGESGNRPLLRLDTITITSQTTEKAVALAATEALPNVVESGVLLPAFSIRAVNSQGQTDTAFDREVRIRVDGVATLAGTLVRNAINGEVVFDGLILRGAGTVALVATSEGLPPLIVKVIDVSPALGLTYENWRDVVYTDPADRADAGISGPYAIGESGWANLIRYAFEVYPSEIDTLLMPQIESDAAGHFFLRVPYPGDRNGVAYIAEQLNKDLAVEATLFDSRVDTIPESAAIDGAIFILVSPTESTAPTYFRVRLESL